MAAARSPAGVALSSYVRPREAAAFTRVAAFLGGGAGTLERLRLDEVLAAVQDAARAALGPKARVTLAGSVAKGTQVGCSDVDLLVHTPVPATLEQRRALEARLQAHPGANPAHVRLLKLAIHAKLFGLDVDVVCADTVEYGARPGPDARVAADAVAGSCARALKAWGARAVAGGRKLPGHALEALALHCRSSDADDDAAPHAAVVGDGALQLFVTVLQRIVDGGVGGGILRQCTRLDAPTRADLLRLAKSTLHVFALSRAILPGSCFRGADEARRRCVRQAVILGFLTRSRAAGARLAGWQAWSVA